MLYTINTTREKSKEILHAALNGYNAIKEKDRRENAESLQPGQNVGYANYNGFYKLENRESAANELFGYREQINNLLNDVENEINKRVSEPPTTEQTNLLTVLSIGKPTKEELQAVLNANKDNYSVCSALGRIAAENGFILNGDTPNEIKELNNLQAELSSHAALLDIANAETHLTPGMISFFDVNL